MYIGSMKQRIVVTGAAGFLGGRTAKYLASNFDIFEIIATSRRGHRSKELAAEGCLFIQGDLCDPDHC